MEIANWIGLASLFMAFIIPTLTVMLKVNSTLTELNANMKREHEDGIRRTQRLDSHSQKLDQHSMILENHAIRIDHLEHRNDD